MCPVCITPVKSLRTVRAVPLCRLLQGPPCRLSTTPFFFGLRSQVTPTPPCTGTPMSTFIEGPPAPFFCCLLESDTYATFSTETPVPPSKGTPTSPDRWSPMPPYSSDAANCETLAQIQGLLCGVFTGTYMRACTQGSQCRLIKGPLCGHVQKYLAPYVPCGIDLGGELLHDGQVAVHQDIPVTVSNPEKQHNKRDLETR